ncbi:MAG TPA: outer membrane beta-barrel protein [Gammaproteobacteria bacterium]|nr:outer membrane beta-barrel protein [Gammaproteobacteria bacterium]
MRTIIALAMLALTPFAAQASNFSYSYVEGGYADFDDTDGLWVGGGYEFMPNFHVVGDLYSLDEADIMEVGVGYHTAISDKADVYGNLKLVNFEVGPFDDDGLGLEGGVRFALAPRFELGGGIRYYSFDEFDSESNLFVRGAFDVASNLAISLEVETGDIMDKMLLGARLSF